MESLRKPFQGVANVVRFNWHFYAISFGGMLLLNFSTFILPFPFNGLACLMLLGVIATTLISLFVTWYVYDASELYQFSWLDDKLNPQTIANIHAGFDETSILLAEKFSKAQLHVFDFYDPLKHTEVSIKRARKAYPPFSNTQPIETSKLPLGSQSLDAIFLILAAHEIRDETERLTFFHELKRVLKPDGKIIIVEHLQDLPNFLAYNIGFLHFQKKKTWRKTFEKTGFSVINEQKITPFISVFTLALDGNSP